MAPQDRESIRIAYVPLEPALADRRNLLRVAESELVLPPGREWGTIKTGAGTPPVRVEEGWMSLFHGVDAEALEDGKHTLRYAAGIVVHDAERPGIVRYRSPAPLLVPELHEERHGVVSDVVFPSGMEVLPAARTFEVYYGMADTRVGRALLELGASELAGRAESAA